MSLRIEAANNLYRVNMFFWIDNFNNMASSFPQGEGNKTLKKSKMYQIPFTLQIQPLGET